MTQIEWESSIEPDWMLRFVRGRVSDRKLRLFAAACFRRLAHLYPDPRQQWGIEVLEQWAEGALYPDPRRHLTAGLRHALPPDIRVPGSPPTVDLHFAALMLYREFCSSSIAIHAILAPSALADGTAERYMQAHLMRCIMGDPFHHIWVDSRWVSHAVVALARVIYEERDFSPLPILADALEEAGCDEPELLSHCRSEDPHVRGCWVIDSILGKE